MRLPALVLAALLLLGGNASSAVDKAPASHASIVLTEAHTYVVETCRSMGRDARVDIYPDRIRVSCVAR